jgi:hypothetical protein
MRGLAVALALAWALLLAPVAAHSLRSFNHADCPSYVTFLKIDLSDSN